MRLRSRRRPETGLARSPGADVAIGGVFGGFADFRLKSEWLIGSDLVLAAYIKATQSEPHLAKADLLSIGSRRGFQRRRVQNLSRLLLCAM